MKPATLRMERVALQWRGLAERRRDHFVGLYRSGRWRRYYTNREFLDALRSAVNIADRWAAIAPRLDEGAPKGNPAQLPPDADQLASRSAAAVLPAAA